MLSHDSEIIVVHSVVNSQKKAYSALAKSIAFIASHRISPRQLNAGVLIGYEQE